MNVCTVHMIVTRLTIATNNILDYEKINLTAVRNVHVVESYL